MQVPITGTNDMTTIHVCTAVGKVIILDIYYDCTNADMIYKICSFLTDHCDTLMMQDLGHMIWHGDFNCHHPMWDEECNSHLFTVAAMTGAELLILLIANFGTSMALPLGTTTLQSHAMGNWTRVDNVFFSEGLVNCVVI